MATVTRRSVLWRRLDHPGYEALRLLPDGAGWQLVGTAVFAFQREPCRLGYVILCDAQWRTKSTKVDGWVGAEAVQHELAVDPAGRWRFDGTERADLDGCIDLDLAFSPATNTLPIRRLNLAIGEAARVQAAWLRFPGFALEPLNQLYRRLDVARYRYESGSGRFVRELDVDADGLIERYPDFWEMVAAQ